MLRIATSRDDIDVVAVNDPFIDAKYMVMISHILCSLIIAVNGFFYDFAIYFRRGCSETLFVGNGDYNWLLASYNLFCAFRKKFHCMFSHLIC